MNPRPIPPRATWRLILGDQLNPAHSWFDAICPQTVYVMMEMRQETDYVRHHAQKVIGILAAMRDLCLALRAQGHCVVYLALNDPDNRQSLTDNLTWLLTTHQATAFEYQSPDEWRLDHQLAEWTRQQTLPCRMVDSDHFLTGRHDAAALFKGRKQWLMEHFYRTMRKRHRVLLDANDEPVGGQWNFDADNRKPWRGDPPEPADTRPLHDHTAIWEEIVAGGVQTMGAASAHAFRWPLNRREALQQLDDFITHGLPHFGDYQDALSQRHSRLFHSLLSFALNTKMLHPREVIDRAEQAWHAGGAPLHAVEGFIRQILGWREYVRGIYWATMPGYTQRNALGHERPLPDWFWTGQTQMACMAKAIGQSLDDAYAHHIQRLMVIGNFALLAGLDPEAVHRWYLGVYIDAFEWVEAPNTLGMSQFADGGLLATKPYVSSAAYLQRMGDHCTQCRYKAKEKTGPHACPFNALYWDFFARHHERFARNPRLGMVYKHLQSMDGPTLDALRAQAAQTLNHLDSV